MADQPPDGLRTSTGRRTPASSGERALVALFAAVGVVVAVLTVLGALGGSADDLALASPSASPAARTPEPTTAPTPASTPMAEPVFLTPDPLFSQPPGPTPEPGGDPWTVTATHLRGRDFRIFVFDCPPGGPAFGVLPPIWGSGPYTDDSAVCVAAVHAGWATLDAGGRVWIRIVPGLASYVGSRANGIQAEPYPEWYGSYRFERVP